MKKIIFAALALAVIGVFAIKISSNTTVNDLLRQNIEALANDPIDPNEGAAGGEGSWCYTQYNFSGPNEGKVCKESSSGTISCSNVTTNGVYGDPVQCQ